MVMSARKVAEPIADRSRRLRSAIGSETFFADVTVVAPVQLKVHLKSCADILLRIFIFRFCVCQNNEIK